jgi:hypothetical protein
MFLLKMQNSPLEKKIPASTILAIMKDRVSYFDFSHSFHGTLNSIKDVDMPQSNF